MYRDILGFDVKMYFYDEGEKARIIFLNMGNSMLELIVPDDPPIYMENKRWEERKKKGVEHIAFLMEDMDKTCEYFYGPEGILLDLISWKA